MISLCVQIADVVVDRQFYVTDLLPFSGQMNRSITFVPIRANDSETYFAVLFNAPEKRDSSQVAGKDLVSACIKMHQGINHSCKLRVSENIS